eukprot:3928695-Amphidinium_carterae.1
MRRTGSNKTRRESESGRTGSKTRRQSASGAQDSESGPGSPTATSASGGAGRRRSRSQSLAGRAGPSPRAQDTHLQSGPQGLNALVQIARRHDFPMHDVLRSRR